MIDVQYKIELQKLNNKNITKIIPELDSSAIWITIADNSRIFSAYWRLLTKKGERLSSFDHNQRYGTPEPINAVVELKEKILERVISEVKFLEDSGDIEIIFDNGFRLQIFNFTSNEVWEIALNGEDGELSNYN